jgi:hypothetical protein
MTNATWDASRARGAFFSPSRFPMRTEVAMLSAYGAWYVIEHETRSTDCVASATGPSLARASAQFGGAAGARARNALAGGDCKTRSARKTAGTAGRARTPDELPRPPLRRDLPCTPPSAPCLPRRLCARAAPHAPTPESPSWTRTPRLWNARAESGCHAVRGTNQMP